MYFLLEKTGFPPRHVSLPEDIIKSAHGFRTFPLATKVYKDLGDRFSTILDGLKAQNADE